VNIVIVTGRLTHDPELRETKTGTRVCNFSVAVNERWRTKDGIDKERTEYVPIVVWGNQAEVCNKHLGRGHGVTIHGRMQTQTYDDREGVARKKTEVIADRVEFGERPKLTQPKDDEIPF